MYFNSGHQKHTVLFFFFKGKYQGFYYKMKVMVVYSYKYSSVVSSEELYRKLGIGPEKANATLNVRTQMNVRLAILPLTKRYRNYILSQELRRLRVNFYTENLFACEISVWGNKCAQLYADRELFIYILPMSSNAVSGDSLGDVVNNIGIMNEIYCDNALEQVMTNA